MHISQKLSIQELGQAYSLTPEQQQAVLCWLAWHLWDIQNPSEGPGCCKVYDPLAISWNDDKFIASSYVLLNSGRGFDANSLDEIEQRLMANTLEDLRGQESGAEEFHRLNEIFKERIDELSS